MVKNSQIALLLKNSVGCDQRVSLLCFVFPSTKSKCLHVIYLISCFNWLFLVPVLNYFTLIVIVEQVSTKFVTLQRVKYSIFNAK